MGKKTWFKPGTYYAQNRERVLDKAKRRNDALRTLAAGRPKPSNGTCEVCKTGPRRLVWDHCHATGRFRGWICYPCNNILGAVNDDPALLRKLAEYSARHSSIAHSETL